MKVADSFKNYFYGFQDIAQCAQNDAKTNAFAILKIISYFTVLIPLCFAALYTAASLCGRGNKIESLSDQDLGVKNIAKKLIVEKEETTTPFPQEKKSEEEKIEKIEPKVPSTQENLEDEKIERPEQRGPSPEEIRAAAQTASEGEFIHTGAKGTSFTELLGMIDRASLEEIRYIIEGALNHNYSSGLTKALGRLLELRNISDLDTDKQKLKLAIQTITEERLLELFDKNKFPSNYLESDKAKLLKKYINELSLSDESIKQIEDYIDYADAFFVGKGDNFYT